MPIPISTMPPKIAAFSLNFAQENDRALLLLFSNTERTKNVT